MSADNANAAAPPAPVVDAAAAPAHATTNKDQPITAAIPNEEIGFKVFAGNLAYSTTEETLRTFFAPVAADIITVQVIQRGTRSAGYGFVAFNTEDAAKAAVTALDKKELDGRTVIVEVAKPADEKERERTEHRKKKRTSRRGDKAVTGEVTEAEANGETSGTAGKPAEGDAAPKKKAKKARKPKKKTGDAAEGADKAAEGTEATRAAGEEKKAPKAKKARKPKPTRPAGEAPEGEPSATMLFVANLAFTIDDAALAALFTDQGVTVNSARVIRRRWGQPRRSKGYGFVDVGGPEAQKSALEKLQGKEVEGREIAVKIAVNAPHEDDDEGEGKGEGAKDASPEATIVAQ